MRHARILVVQLGSTYTHLVSERRHAGVANLVEAHDPLVEKMIAAHKRHDETIEKVKSALEKRELDSTWSAIVGELDLDEFDLVVPIGGDGTVLHASHAIGNTPVLAVNSSPTTSVGFFTAATADNFGEVLDQVLAGSIDPVTLCRMEIRVNDEIVTKRALNDVLFCHDCPASTTRYVLTFNGDGEDQLSSGVWVSTAAGSTAAIRAAGGKAMPARSRRLQFMVREPFPSGGAEEQTHPQLIHGFISEGETLSIRSKTAAARLYVDGPHVVFPVDFGDKVTFSRSDESLRLFGYNKKDK